MSYILVVDDEKSIRITVGEFLKSAGYSVEIAENADVALKLLSTKNFDIVVSDIILPRITGIDLLKSIRKISPNVQVILMTGEPNLETASEAVRAGAFDYLTKPITKEKITRIVALAVKIKKIDDERRRLEIENKLYQNNLEKLVEERTKSLEESEEKFRSLVEEINVVPWRLDLKTSQFTYIGKQVESMLGYPAESWIDANTWASRIHQDDREKSVNYCLSCSDKGEDHTFEYRALAKDGEFVWIKDVVTVRKNIEGDPYELIGYMINITERKLVEIELKESEKRFLQVVDATGEWIWEVDKDGLYTYTSKACESLLGFMPDEIIGKKYFYDFLDTEEKDDFKKRALEIFAKKESFKNFKNPNMHKDGRIVVLETNGTPILDEKGNLLGYRGADKDITKRIEDEKKLRESEEQFRILMEQSPLSIQIYDFDGFMLNANKAWMDLWEVSDLTGVLGHFNIFRDLQLKEMGLTKEFKKVIAGEKINIQNVKFDPIASGYPGRLRFINISAYPLVTKEGLASYFVVFNEDVSERNKSEELLRKSEAKFRTIVENTEQILFMIDNDGIFTLSEGKGLAALGLAPGQVVGQSASEVYKDFPEIIKGIRIALEGVANNDTINVGNLFLDIWYSPIKNVKGDISGIVGMAVNITEQHTNAKNLEISENKFRSVVESAPDAIISIGAGGIIIGWNQSAEKIFGYSFEDVVGENITIVIPDRFIEKHVSSLSRAQEKEDFNISGNGIVELFGKRKDGSEFPLEMSMSHWKISDEIFFTALIRDSSERKKIEKEILKLNNAIEQSITSIVITDREGNIEYVNKYFTKVTGYSKKEVIGKNPRILKTDCQARSKYKKMWKKLKNGKTWSGEFCNRKKNGELFWEKAVISPIVDKSGHIINFVAIKEDITEWKKTEDERLHLEKIVKSSVNEIYIFDKEMLNFSFLNDSALKNIGYSLEEMKLLTPIEIIPEMTFTKFKEKCGPLIDNEKQFVKFQTMLQRRDKSTYPVDISLQLLEHGDEEKFAAIIIDITKRKKNEAKILEYQTHLEEKIEERTEEISVINEMLKKEIIKKDKAEKRVSDSLVKEKDLNKIKDQFMSTVSHDLRTPLAAIQSSVELMERFYDKWDKERVINKYSQIKSSVSRITDMLSHVLELSKIERGNTKVNYETVNLKKEFQTIINEVDSIKSEEHDLVYSYNLEEENHNVDINLLREILNNLLTNGIKYSPDGGKVELLVNQEDQLIILQVSDEGMGIDKGEIENVFNDFYRTAESQNISGSGLGLSIVKHYVEMYKGEIEVESELGKGSVFRVKIPQNFN